MDTSLSLVSGFVAHRHSPNAEGRGHRLSCSYVLACLALAFLAGFALPSEVAGQASGPELWVPNGTVRGMALDEQRLYLGGDFSYIGPATGGGVLFRSGESTPSESFPRVDGAVLAAAPDGEGGWYIGGQFLAVGGHARNNLAHIASDNSVSDWAPTMSGNGSDATQVNALVLIGGTVYVGGVFETLGGAPRKNLGAIDAVAGLVTSWNPNPTSPQGYRSYVYCMVADGDRIFVGGEFHYIGGSERSRVAAISTVTGLPTTWDARLSYLSAIGAVRALLKSGANLYLGGSFGEASGQTRYNAAAFDLEADTLVAWAPAVSGTIHALAASGTALYLGGSFGHVAGEPRPNLAAVDATTGGLLPWPSNASDVVSTLSIAGGRLYAGGAFQRIDGAGRRHLAELDIVTRAVTAWNSDASDPVSVIVSNDTSLLVGGRFTSMGGVERRLIACIDATTGRPTSWMPDIQPPGSMVNDFAVAGATVYVGGWFKSVNGVSRQHVVAIDAVSGAVLPWNPPLFWPMDQTVFSLALDDTRLYASGSYGSVALDRAGAGAIAWNVLSDRHVNDIAVDGAVVYVVGAFSAIGGVTRSGAAALDGATGVVQPWNPALNAEAHAVCSSGASIIVGGGFSEVNGVPRNRLAALSPATAQLTDWNPGGLDSHPRVLLSAGPIIYIGGAFTAIGADTRRGLAAVDASSGAVLSWSADLSASGHVRHLVSSGATLYVSGVFSMLGGLPRLNLAALPAVTAHTITASAGPNGSISPSGAVAVISGASQTFTITPHTGYTVGDVLVNGNSVGAVNSYTFTNVTADHTISASFLALEPPPLFVLKWGEQGSGNGQFNNASDVAVHLNGKVYVADTQNHRVQVFTNQGGWLQSWNGFDYPIAVNVGPDHKVWVLEEMTGLIKGLNPETGAVESAIGVEAYCHDFAIDRDGNFYLPWFTQHKVRKYSPTGSVLLTIGTTEGSAVGQFSYPIGIGIGPDGSIYVADRGNARVQQFDAFGQSVRSWGSPGAGAGQFGDMWTIACNAAGEVYVTDRGNCRVQKFTSDGRALALWGACGSENGQFAYADPEGIAIDADGYVYCADRFNSRIQKFGPGGSSGTGGLRPVLLVHGYCGEPDMWNDLVAYLNAKGFLCYAVDLVENNDRPNELAADLAAVLDGPFAGQEVDVIAHSMGGLVTRQYIRQRKQDSRIRTLITLGTPHHGSDLMSLAFKTKAVSKYLKGFSPFACMLGGPAAGDLATGSPFLNNLNYDTSDPVDRHWLQSSRGPHLAEMEYGAGVKIWTIAGTSHFDGPARRATGPAWFSTSRLTYLVTDHVNDGVVGVDAATLWNNPDHVRIDTDMGMPEIQHLHNSLLYGLDNSQAFHDHAPLFPIYENLLRGGMAPGSPPSAPQLIAQTAQGEADSTAIVVLSVEGTVSPGMMYEHPFNLPLAPVMQVMAVSGAAGLNLRQPNGALLTPADTLSVPELQYVEDAVSGLRGYVLGNPSGGLWHAVFDASSAGSNVEYAVDVLTVGTMEVAVDVGQSVLYSPTTSLRVSLDDTGVSTSGASWNVTILNPDSSTFGVEVYDDGAHSDGAAGDGVFGATLDLPAQRGVYGITAIGTPPSSSVTYVGASLIELVRFSDLLITSDLQVSRNAVTAGDSLVLSAMIRNDGGSAVSSLDAEFWDGSVRFAVVTLPSLAAGDSQLVSQVWHAAAPDTHNLRITIDPFVIADEATYENNSVNRQVILGQPIVGVEIPLPTRLQLGPVAPNPFRGSTAIHFATAVAGPATLGAYDVAGRLINKWHWDNLAAGQHVVQWDGRTASGTKLRAGIIFLRLGHGSSGTTRTTRVVLVR